MKPLTAITLALLVGVFVFAWTVATYEPTGGTSAGRGGARVWYNGAPLNETRLAWGSQDYEMVTQHAEKVVAAAPGSPEGYMWLALALERQGEPDEARRVWGMLDELCGRRMQEAKLEAPGQPFRGSNARVARRIRTSPREDWTAYYAGWAAKGLGEAQRAQELWRGHLVRYETAGTADQPNYLYNVACFRALTGDTDGALTSLEMALQSKRADPAWAMVDPDLMSLYADPRFVDVVGATVIGEPNPD